MKLALLTNFIPPYRLSLYREMERLVDDFRILVSTDMEKNRNWAIDHKGLDVVVQRNISFKKTWKYGYESFIHIPYDTFFQLRKYDPDLVITAELGFRSLFASIYCRLYKKPYILWLALSEHTELSKKGIRIMLRKYLLKNCAAILCNGESSKKYVEGFGFKKKIYFVPCTSDYELKPVKNDFRSAHKKILYTGYLIELKGIKEMVEGLIDWSKTNPNSTIELIIAGEGAEKVHFQKLDSIQNITYNLLGYVNYQELQKWYQKVDLYIFPSLQDEWGVVVNESFSSGVPVIGSIYSQAVLELVSENETGWQYDPLKNGALAEALEKAINTDVNELQKMSAKCLKTISEVTPTKVSSNIHEAIIFASKSPVSHKKFT